MRARWKCLSCEWATRTYDSRDKYAEWAREAEARGHLVNHLGKGTVEMALIFHTPLGQPIETGTVWRHRVR